MVKWMGGCDCIITKAGPGTIAEALIRGLPIILNDYIPGQVRIFCINLTLWCAERPEKPPFLFSFCCRKKEMYHMWWTMVLVCSQEVLKKQQK